MTRDREHLSFRNWRWWTVALRGVASILFGVLALRSPATAFVSLVVVFGVYAIADGFFALALGARPSLLPRGAIVTRGIVSIIAGALALLWPGMTSLVLLLVIATWATVSGVMEVVMAFRLRHVMEHEWMLGIEGALSIAFGVLLFVSPLAGAITLGLWVGAFALIAGGLMVGTAFRLREHEHVGELTSGDVTPRMHAW